MYGEYPNLEGNLITVGKRPSSCKGYLWETPQVNQLWYKVPSIQSTNSILYVQADNQPRGLIMGNWPTYK